MKESLLKGVIAAVPTPIAADGEPDLPRFVALSRYLLDSGCDALNVCGTTGEATSLSRQQRMAVMSAAAEALPPSRLMVGTGAAAVADAVALTRHAAELGYAGALLLPPFYYKGIEPDGIVAYFDRIAATTADAPIDLYLYNFPALSGVAYTPPIVRRLIETFGSRICGLKDSSGDLAYASEVAALSPDFRVFPSNEAVLLQARAGAFAGCISASANINAPWCARAFHAGDATAQATASEIRAIVSRGPLIAGVKAVVADLLADPAYEALLPPLTPLTAAAKAALLRDYRAAADPAGDVLERRAAASA